MIWVSHEYSVARTSQQSVVAERRNITLKEAARTMIAETKLPKRFCVEATYTASCTQNKYMINKQDNKTPYELWKKGKINISYLHNFRM